MAKVTKYLNFRPKVKVPVVHEALKDTRLALNRDVKSFELPKVPKLKKQSLIMKRRFSLWHIILFVLLARLLWFVVIHTHIKIWWA